MLAKGDRVVATARKEETLADLERQYPNHGRAVRLDITDLAQVTASAQAAISAFGRIDVLVNSAGTGLVGAVEEVSDAQIRQRFETNIFWASRCDPRCDPAASSARIRPHSQHLGHGRAGQLPACQHLSCHQIRH